jgi:hypothetical protein
MRKLISIPVVLILAAFVHIDFHLARPADHHWSFGLSWHWVMCAVVFGLAGWYLARRSPADRWRAAFVNVLIALVIGQGVEPLLEQLYFNQRLAYDVSPDRWVAFWWCAGVGGAAMAAVLAAARAHRPQD